MMWFSVSKPILRFFTSPVHDSGKRVRACNPSKVTLNHGVSTEPFAEHECWRSCVLMEGRWDRSTLCTQHESSFIWPVVHLVDMKMPRLRFSSVQWWKNLIGQKLFWKTLRSILIQLIFCILSFWHFTLHHSAYSYCLLPPATPLNWCSEESTIPHLCPIC